MGCAASKSVKVIGFKDDPSPTAVVESVVCQPAPSPTPAAPAARPYLNAPHLPALRVLEFVPRPSRFKPLTLERSSHSLDGRTEHVNRDAVCYTEFRARSVSFSHSQAQAALQAAGFPIHRTRSNGGGGLPRVSVSER